MTITREHLAAVTVEEWSGLSPLRHLLKGTGVLTKVKGKHEEVYILA